MKLAAESNNYSQFIISRTYDIPPKKIVIKSLATANPAKKVTQGHVYKVLGETFKLKQDEKELYRKILLSGPIKTRYFGLDYDEQIVLQKQDDLIARFTKYARLIAAEASRESLEKAALKSTDIGCLVVNTCTGYLCPGLSSYLAEDLHLDSSVRVVDIAGMGCGAALVNLECASKMMPYDSRAALSVAVEICSATFFMGPEPDLVVSNCIFGDGASAAIVTCVDKNDNENVATLLDFESLVLPKERESLRYRWEQGRLRNMLDKRVPITAARGAKKVAEKLLQRNRLGMNEIDFWAVHPGGSVVLEKIREVLGLSSGALDYSHQVLRDFGNMSSPSVMFVFEKILRKGNPKSGQKCILLSFGAGFTAFAGLVEF
jgi:predicted naringenin-chalcone synthase